MRNYLPLIAFAAIAPLFAQAEVKRTMVPIGTALDHALAQNSLTSLGAVAFHIKMGITEPENAQSPYQGSVEEWWQSPTQWRMEVTAKDGMRQTIVLGAGKKTEQDEGTYFPLWLRNFVTALTDPVPNAAAWTTSGAMIEQITVQDGRKSAPCVRAKSKIGDGENATDAFSSVCFDGQGRLGSVVSPRYSMEFHDYRKFAQKEIACSLVSDPEPGTKLVGAVAILEELSRVQNSDNLFRPLAQNDDRFRGVQVSTKQLQEFFASNGPIVWPAVRSGNLHGKLAMYVGVDGAGNVRETWPLNSDNAGLEDPARAQVMKWTMKGPVDADGYAVQIDGALGFAFATNIGDPLPLLDDIETRRLARTIIEPVLTQSGLPSGQVIQVDIGVNEQGNLTGETFPKLPDAAVGALLQSLSKWEFNPLIRDGRPQYFHGILKFKVP